MLNTALHILKTLNSMGYEAYIVGGYVREFLLKQLDFESLVEKDGRLQEPFSNREHRIDIDIASSARPEIILKTFEKVIKTGIDYGTVTILLNDYAFEHTTFRKDLKYKENSRSAIVSYSQTLEEDVKRRDFTINAFAMDCHGKIYDFFNGKKDLENKCIRAIGKADQRFQEDPLRKLRAIRFAGTLNFEIEKETFEAIKEKPSLKGLSKERIKWEFDKILNSSNSVHALKLLEESNLIDEIIPKFNDEEQFNRGISRLSILKGDLPLLYAGLFFDWNPKELKSLMLHLKFSKKELKKILFLVSQDRELPDLTKEEVRLWMARLGPEHLWDFYKLIFADSKIGNDTNKMKALKTLSQILKEISSEKNVFSRADLAIKGTDLIQALNLKDTEYFLLNQIFSELLEHCIKNPDRNNRNFLINEAKKIRAKL